MPKITECRKTRMKNRLFIVLALALVLILAGCGGINIKSSQSSKDHSECQLDTIELNKDDRGVAIYEGVKHDCILDYPESTEGAPLVIMLPGYGESAEGFRRKTSFEQTANDRGYAVVYITGAPSPEDSTSSSGWNSGIGISSNDDVGFLCATVNYLCDTYSFDRKRVFAIGFSNGAFMTHRLAMEADDVFAGVVSVAGMMPESIWDKRSKDHKMSVFQITGEKDDVVPKHSDGSAASSKAPAIEEVISYYVEGSNLTLTNTSSIGEKSILRKYTSEESKIQVWDMFIENGRHSWPEERMVGFDINQVIIDYLDTQ